MAKRSQDLAAAKAKKQKIILIVGGVLLLAVAAIQGPKLLKGSGSTAAPAASCRDRSGEPAPRRRPRSPSATAAARRARSSVAGVALPKATVVKVAPNQLASFTLFEVKDPFVPQVGDDASPRPAPHPPTRTASAAADSQARPTRRDGRRPARSVRVGRHRRRTAARAAAARSSTRRSTSTASRSRCR